MSGATKTPSCSTITVFLPTGEPTTREVRTAIWLEPDWPVMGSYGRGGKSDPIDLLELLGCGIAALANATGESPEECARAAATLAHRSLVEAVD